MKPNPIPTGKVVRTSSGYDLVITRRFSAPIDDVWASVTESERTARWFGPWRGKPGAGRTIELQLGFEDGTPWSKVTINACEPPHHLDVTTSDEAGSWHLELFLTEADGTTELTLLHHRPDTDGVGDFGPGWEYYFDMLVASREDQPLPDFDSYFPAQREYFLQAASDAAQKLPQ